MRQINNRIFSLRGTSLIVAASLPFAIAAALLLSRAEAQQVSTVTFELREAFAAARAGERVPVLVELSALSAPEPISFDRRVRALEQASYLADRYGAAAERLRLDLPTELRLDLFAGDVLWVGGALRGELTEAELEALASTPGVRRIYYDGLVRVDLWSERRSEPFAWPTSTSPSQDPAGGLPWGLLAIRAPELWARGVTGQGAVVAIIDSGVDLDHPLLRNKWRGSSVPAEQAWFDPWGLTDLPIDDNGTAGVGHGTIVATVAVGGLSAGDTLVELGGSIRIAQDDLDVVTGVAPGAEWMAVNAFQEFGGFSYTRRSILLQAMQWALDPDGDPATLSDVPTVVNNSWGFFSDGCGGLFDRAIDALEHAGIPVVFASGNRQPGVDTVAAPANRADLLANAFAVGAADQVGGQIIVAENSLGGPTPCAANAVKPEVVAPGNVPIVRRGGDRTAVVGGRSGAFTSWAAPHATGALALLAPLSPGTAGSELKGALFSSAVDLDPPGLDNRSGAGIIDVAAAAELIGGLGAVALRVTSWELNEENRSATVRLLNAGRAPFTGGLAELRSGAEALARVHAPLIDARARAELGFSFAKRAVPARALKLVLESEGAILEFPLTRASAPATSLQLRDGSVALSLDANGRLGRTAGLNGFSFLGGDWLTSGSIVFGTGDRVSDAMYVDVLARPSFKPNPVGSDTDWSGSSSMPPGMSDRAQLELSDRRALRPLGASLSESARLVSLGDTAAFVALSVTIGSPASLQAPLAGLFLDWDLGVRDSATWDPQLGAALMTAPDGSSPWFAMTAEPRPPTTSGAIPLGATATGFYVLGTGVLAEPVFADEEKARFLRLGGETVSRSAVDDWAQMIAVGPVAAGDDVVFLIAAGASRPALAMALDSARALAASITPGGSSAAVTSLELLAPYPNPFDPIAHGAVRLPFLVSRGAEAVEATLEIYTISGRLMYSENRELTADLPVEPFVWDGRDASGEAVASGVYGYIIRVGGERRFAKFVVLK